MVMELAEGEDVKCFAVPFFMIGDFLYAKSTDLRDGFIRMEIRIFNDFGFVLELHECSHLEKDENDSIGRRWRQIKDKRYALCADVTHSLIIFTDNKMCYRPTLLTPFQPLWKYPLRKDIEYSGKDIPDEMLESCLDHVLVPRSVDGAGPATKRTRAPAKVPAPTPALKPTLYEFLHSTGIDFMDFSRFFKAVQRMGIPDENGGESREAALIYMDGELWDVVARMRAQILLEDKKLFG